LFPGIRIDCIYFSFKHAIGKDWEPFGGKDYINTGPGIFICDKNMVKGVILKINIRQFIIKYCPFGSLEIRDLQKACTSKNIYTMSSKDW
jgi:hypothetical protein